MDLQKLLCTLVVPFGTPSTAVGHVEMGRWYCMILPRNMTSKNMIKSWKVTIDWFAKYWAATLTLMQPGANTKTRWVLWPRQAKLKGWKNSVRSEIWAVDSWILCDFLVIAHKPLSFQEMIPYHSGLLWLNGFLHLSRRFDWLLCLEEGMRCPGLVDSSERSNHAGQTIYGLWKPLLPTLWEKTASKSQKVS